MLETWVIRALGGRERRAGAHALTHTHTHTYPSPGGADFKMGMSSPFRQSWKGTGALNGSETLLENEGTAMFWKEGEKGGVW